jgi:hypothetical protein
VRKEALRGQIRDALDVSAEHFEARMEKRLRANTARASMQGLRQVRSSARPAASGAA